MSYTIMGDTKTINEVSPTSKILYLLISDGISRRMVVSKSCLRVCKDLSTNDNNSKYLINVDLKIKTAD